MPLIPEWNGSAVLPPIRPGASGTSHDRSPYIVHLADVISRFGTSSERIIILKGLLDYRFELSRRGITSGFQWLDGSFVENKEAPDAAPPQDIDVVTFFHLPTGVTQQEFLPKIVDLFANQIVKQKYHVDAFPCVLGGKMEEPQIKNVSYWYSMWSHRRNGIWKGFVQIPLSEVADHAAADILKAIEQEGATK